MRLSQLLRFEHELRRGHYGADRITQIVTEDREEHLLRFVEVLRKSRDRLGERLVDRLVETREVDEIAGRHFALVPRPESDYARAQRAILRHHLIHREATLCSARPVLLGSGPRLVDESGRVALRFFRLFVRALRSLEIL